MPSAEIAEHWVGYGEVLGFILFGVFSAWLKNYHDARNGERRRVAEGTDIVSRSIGAAFVDRTTAEHIASMAHDIKCVLEILISRQEKSDRAQLKRELIEELEAKQHQKEP